MNPTDGVKGRLFFGKYKIVKNRFLGVLPQMERRGLSVGGVFGMVEGVMGKRWGDFG